MNDKDLNDLIKYNPFSKTEYYPIKNKVLNGLLGGKGLVKGSILHIAAGSGTGKSTIVLKDICVDLLNQGQDIAYIDADRGINTEIMKSTGIYKYHNNTDKSVGGTFLVFRKSTFHEINELIQDLIEKGVQIIVLDTLSIVDGGMYMGKNAYDIENQKVGGNTKAIKQLMMNMNVLAEKDSRKINFIILNHTAKEIGGMSFGPPKENPKGGDAPIAFSDIVIKLMKYSDKSETYNDKPIGQKVFATIMKSRHATGKVKVPFFIRYGKGISNILTYKEIFESGKSVEGCYIEAKGRTYYLKHPKLNQEIKYVGKDNLLQAIIENYQVIDELFSSEDWVIDVTKESEILDIEYSLEDLSKLPKQLQDLKVVTSMNGNIYFMRGIDSTGQGYGVFYNTNNNKLIKEFDSSVENVSIKEAQKAMDEINKYLEDLDRMEAEKSIDDKLDEVEMN